LAQRSKVRLENMTTEIKKRIYKWAVLFKKVI
jgi:hypothetical protein